MSNKRLSEQKKTVIGFREKVFLRTPSSPLLAFCKNAGGRTTANRKPSSKNGMALIIVVAIIAVLSAIGATFMYTMRMEEKAAFNHMNSLKASYIAKSGVEHAIASLKSDSRDAGFVSYEDSRWGYKNQSTGSIFSALDETDENLSIDNDGLSITKSDDVWASGGMDSRWFYVEDDNGDTIGRYAVLIIDESSKININTAGDVSVRQGWTPFEIDFEKFFDYGNTHLGWNYPPGVNALIWANNVVNYRYGDDLIPGDMNEDHFGDSPIIQTDGIDNDASGAADDTDEWRYNPKRFIPWKPYGDDVAFITIEEIKEVDEIGTTTFNKLKPYITIYSADENTTNEGLLRMNINLVRDAAALYTAMYEAWSDLISSDFSYDDLKQLAAQAAVNTIDYADTDNVATFLDFSHEDSGNASSSDNTHLYDDTKTWTPDDCWKDAKITVISGGIKQIRTIIDSGSDWVEIDGTWDIVNPPANTPYHIQDNAIARGVEAIRINEIMVKPAYQWESEELFGEDNAPDGDGKLGDTDWYDTDLSYVGVYSPDTDTGICSFTPSAVIEADMEIWREHKEKPSEYLTYRVRALTYSSAPYHGVAEEVGSDTLLNNVTVWNPGDWEGAIVTISSGISGVGQKRVVESNTGNELKLKEPWNPIPDNNAGFSLAQDHSFTIRLISSGGEEIIELKAGAHNIGGWLLEDLGRVIIKEVGKGKIELETGEYTNEHNGAYLDYIQLSQQPDCEYVELVNISDNEVDISGWTLETSAGFVGTIPEKTTIEAGDYLVLAVDKNDLFWSDFRKEDIPETLKGLTKGKDDIYFEKTWSDADEKRVVPLHFPIPPVNIAENVFGDTIILPGSMFTDLPPAAPIKWEEDEEYDDIPDNTTLRVNGASWDNDQWKGATIAVIMDVDGVADTQIVRQVQSNTSDKITITTKWSWDDVYSPASTSEERNYYIYFEPMAVTLYEGSLADQQIVSQVTYTAEDIKNQVAYEQENGVKVYGFVALEKNAPTSAWDRTGDGIDDFWHLNIEEKQAITIEGEPIRGGTPGNRNSIAVLYEKDPSEDVKVPNLPFATVGDIKDVGTVKVEYSGRASGGGNDTLTVSGFPWTINLEDAVVVIVSGKGAGQIRIVDNKPNDHTIEITEEWDIIPDNTSEYVIFFEWARVGYDDLGGDYTELVKRIADKITVSQKRLEAEKAEEYVDIYNSPDPWEIEKSPNDDFPTYYYSTDLEDTAVWTWGVEQRLHPERGVYDLYISGKVIKDSASDPDTMLVQVTTGHEAYEPREISFLPDNMAYLGQIKIEGNVSVADLPSGYAPSVDEALLQIKIWKDYAANTICFDAVVLTPERRTYGRINVNTADKVVLLALPGIGTNPGEYDPQYIIDARPFETIGEILDVPNDGEGDEITMYTFSKISNLITTKSKIFTIISTGQALRKSDNVDVIYNNENYEILGEKKYMVTMER